MQIKITIPFFIQQFCQDFLIITLRAGDSVENCHSYFGTFFENNLSACLKSLKDDQLLTP